MIRRTAAAATLLAAIVVLTALPAAAHVTISGTGTQGGYGTFSFKVPNEEDAASTTKLEVQFPTDALGTVEGQIVCRWWSARQVFERDDRMSPYYQYTDKPRGTYWCTSHIASSATGEFSISVGTRFADAKWFRGRDTTHRLVSRCPDESCCRAPEAALARRWDEKAWPSARLNSSLLAAMPTGTFTGVDRAAVYEFLEAHAPA